MRFNTCGMLPERIMVIAFVGQQLCNALITCRTGTFRFTIHLQPK
jgi:hypothetical protein